LREADRKRVEYVRNRAFGPDLYQVPHDCAGNQRERYLARVRSVKGRDRVWEIDGVWRIQGLVAALLGDGVVGG
jgi:hypothetical protein